MAVMTMDFRSSELKMSTLVTMVFPSPGLIGDIPLSRRKVLYLLHGLSDDASSYLRYSRVELYSEENGVVIIMPSVGRSMYCDGINGQNYFSYITTELPAYLKLVFGLSGKQEDTYVAGLSMGGLGAMKAALTYPERYAAVGSFSGLLDLRPYVEHLTDGLKDEFPFLLKVMDDPDRSPLNPVSLLDANRHRELKMYVACGLQDDLLPLNQIFKKRADEMKLDVKYVFEDGAHEWDFWDRQLKSFLAWTSQ